MSKEPYEGIGKYQSVEKMTKTQRKWWNNAPMNIRAAIRNGTAPGMSARQILKTSFPDPNKRR